MALTHAKISAAGASSDPTKVGGDDWNEAHTVDADGVVFPASAATPATPAIGNITLFGRTLAGGEMLAAEDSAGMVTALQPFIGRNKIAMWTPQGNSTVTATSIGLAPPGTQGGTAARNVATTNMLTATRRIGSLSAATAGSFTGFRAGAFQFFRGNSPGMGGFRFVARWGCSDAASVAGARTFVGMAPATVTAANPSSLTNLIGVGTDDTDSNLQIIFNDGSGVATKISLGANFPDHTLSADLYELAMYCAPNSGTVGVQVTRLNTGDTYSATLDTNLPVTNTLLGPQFMRSNGPTALAVSIDLVSLYIESDT